MYSISIIIPTFNRREHLKTLLEQLLIQETPVEIKLSVIVVVDGSSDGTYEMLDAEFPTIHVVSGDGNWWYTRSLNEGLLYADQTLNSDFFLCVNDDVEVEPDFIRQLWNSYQITPGRPCLLGCMSVSITPPHYIGFAGTYRSKKFPYWGKPVSNLGDLSNGYFSGVHPTKDLYGRGIFIPKEILKSVKYFDQKNFPQYHSDRDFGLRASKKGFKSFVSYDAKIYAHFDLTSDSTTQIKIPLRTFLKNFTNPYSRKHLIQNAIFMWRHHSKLLFPVLFLGWIIVMFRNHFRVKSSGL